MNCDPLARSYRWLEMATYGNLLWRCRCAFLDEMREPVRILLLGDGDGRFLERLLEVNPNASIDTVDSSAHMLALARARSGDSPRVRFHQADAIEWLPTSGPYDLVVTHFFLDCFHPPQVEQIAANLQRATVPGGRWVICDFRYPDDGAMRWIAPPLIATMYACFRWTTGLTVRRLPGHGPIVATAGFRMQGRTQSAGGLLASELWTRI